MATNEYDKNKAPEAVLVIDGIIAKVGPKNELERDRGGAIEINLEGRTLMPGFVEPHMHLTLMIDYSAITDLSPCLPVRYRNKTTGDDNETIECPVDLAGTWDVLNESPKREVAKETKENKYRWIVANGIDPSRLGNANIDELRLFIANPAKEIENVVTGGKDQPVFLLDQSGHVAYVNMQAFVSAGICEKIDPCGPGKGLKEGIEVPQGGAMGTWDYVKGGNFTGRLLESASYELFALAIRGTIVPPPGGPFLFVSNEEGTKRANDIVDKISRTGVTTIVNAGGFTQAEVEFIRQYAEQNQDNPKLRYRTLISSDIAGDKSVDVANSLKTVVWDDENHGLYGAYGIKWWADGSTQGCSGGLEKKYAEGGLCKNTEGDAGLNYKGDGLIDSLRPFWEKDKWSIHVHANGDRAMKQALDVFKRLQNECTTGKYKPNNFPIVLHHATVAGDPNTNENVIQEIGYLRRKSFPCTTGDHKLNISVSHTPGHVAYWGGAFQSILDGEGQLDDKGEPIFQDSDGRATTLDPLDSDSKNKVPASLHSDAPITPINPLWHVEQVVTRNTWFYPYLKDEDAREMPVSELFADQKIGVYEALRAITIVPAQQNLLDDKIGTIEERKVADLVILDHNPLTIGQNRIHSIEVKSTFVNGIRHDHGHD